MPLALRGKAAGALRAVHSQLDSYCTLWYCLCQYQNSIPEKLSPGPLASAPVTPIP